MGARATGGPTRDIAEFVAGLTFEALPDAVVTQACHIILDTVGCALGAWRDDPEKAGIARDIALSFASRPVSCLWGPELTALYPEKFPARVTILMKDGRKLTATHLFPKGDPQAPLSAAEIETKFMDNASARLAETDARKLAGLIRALPDAKDLSQLNNLLAS